MKPSESTNKKTELERKAEQRVQRIIETAIRLLPLADGYQPGAIISHCWGWEQTNVDFYRIEKRAEQWITLVPLKSRITETGFMTGTATPIDELKVAGKPLRKKLRLGKGKPNGFANWVGASLWNGKPERCSWVA